MKVEPDDREGQKPREVCLTDERGEEFDLMIWEDINEDEKAGSFRVVRSEPADKKDRSVQTEWSMGQESFIKLLKEFPNLQVDRGLLPGPPDLFVCGQEVDPLEWTVVVYPHNQHGGRRVICPSPSLLQSQQEGDWARHPCCGTVRAVRTTPIGPMTDRK